MVKSEKSMFEKIPYVRGVGGSAAATTSGPSACERERAHVASPRAVESTRA